MSDNKKNKNVKKESQKIDGSVSKNVHGRDAGGLFLPFVPSKKEREQVEAMSGLGIPQKDIAIIIGIDHMTLIKHFRKELDAGIAKTNTKIAKRLFDLAMSGDKTALIFWTKARMGWSERIVIEQKTDINIKLSKEEKLEMIAKYKELVVNGGDEDESDN